MPEARPRVSVVIPFKNGEPFLQEAIESVVAQTFRDWELLLVDDGSTDSSAETARDAVARAPERIRLLAHAGGENRGLPASRNLGIRNARGELMAFLDADDVWLPDKLACQIGAFDRHPGAGLVYGPSEWWHSWTGRPEDRSRDHVPDLQVPPDVAHPAPSLLARFLNNEGISPCPSSIMVRRNVAEQVGLCEERFHGYLALYEDQAFYSKIALSAPILRVDQCVARYRCHSGQMTHTRAAQHSAARRFFLEWLHHRVRAHEVSAAQLRGVVRAEYRELVPTPATWVRRIAVRLAMGFARPARALARRMLPQPVRAWLRERLRM